MPDMTLSVFEDPARAGDTEPVVDFLADFLRSGASVVILDDARNKDPAVFNDPLARATAWHPLHIGASRPVNVVFVANHASLRLSDIARQARVAGGPLVRMPLSSAPGSIY